MEGLLAGLAPPVDPMKGKQPFEIPHEGGELTRAARRKIDDDIGELECRIRSLKTRRNELSPISVLPPEVLSKIFIFVRDLPSPIIQYRNEDTHWIRVGHVCHHWRDVALGYPSLWSVPVLTRPALAQQMIHRSKMAALTISSTSSWTPRMLEQLENAMSQISRIQSIHIGLENHPEKINAVLSPLLHPAPLLERVVLSNTHWHLMLGNQYSFPPNALLDAPRLRSIDFVNLNFSWQSAIFEHRNLTVLRLKNNRVATSGASTISQMMDVLDHLPNLHILELINSIPPHTTSSGNESILEFKFLKQLALSAEAVDCTFFLRRIRYPSHATVRLECSSTTTEDCTTILSLTGQYLNRTQGDETGIPHSPAIIRSAQLTSPGINAGVTIAFFDKFEAIRPIYMIFDDLNPIISIRLDGHYFPIQVQDCLLMNVCSFFDLSSLKALFLDLNFTHNQIHLIRDSLGKLPKLNFIHVAQSFPQICLAIARSPKEDPVDRPEETKTRYALRRRKSQPFFPLVSAFPALRTLLVEGVDFRPRRHPEIMEHLVDMLMKRSDMNVPIDNLLLERCPGVQTFHERRLGELVVNLEVEGEVINVKDLDSDSGWAGEDVYSHEGEVYSDDDHFYDDSYCLSGALRWLSDSDT